MNRRQIREEVFKVLFSIDFHPPEDFAEQIDLAMEEIGGMTPEDETYIRTKLQAIAEHCGEIDEAINEVSIGWKTRRMGKAELSILRLAVYEIRWEEAISKAIAINEAVELAKKYGQENAPGFINGILAKIE